MSTTNVKKPPATTGRDSPAGNSAQGSPGTPRNKTMPAGGVARSGSVRTNSNGTPVSARAAVKKPGAAAAGGAGASGSRSIKDTGADEDAKAEAAALMEDLKTRLQKAEEAEEEYQKQVEVLQLRLDEALKEQEKLEERLQEEDERIEGLENEKQESQKRQREMETIYEAERAAVLNDKEATQGREEELQGIIQRLKESLSERDLRPPSDDGRLSRNPSSPSLDANNFAPTSALNRSDSRNGSKLLLQKDKVIESLRLELAEAQIKLVEMENLGGGRLQELERVLLETRMANARLMEDNDSYQLLLSEKTLNGDFARNDIMQSSTTAQAPQTPPRPSGVTSLADELSSTVSTPASETGDDTDKTKRLEAEISGLKDQNKALTLYISKIIERILQHQGGFENILSHAGAPDGSGPAPPPPNKDKELPAPPKDDGPISQPQSFLERAKSVVGGAASRPKPRPQFTSTLPPTPSITDDPATAPSIPLARAPTVRTGAALDRRRTVDWSAAAVVTNMYRGPSGTTDGGPASPGLAAQRNSFFAFGAANRTPSGTAVPTVASTATGGSSTNSAAENVDPSATSTGDAKSARQAALDALEGDGSGTNSNPSSPPRSSNSADRGAPPPSSVMTGSKMRPLRLVQEAAAEDEAAKKAANRGSWFQAAGWQNNVSGWFNREGQSGGGAS